MESSRTARDPDAAIRRSAHLVAFWRDGALRLASYAQGCEVPADEADLRLLDRASGWIRPSALASGWPEERVALERRLARLLDAGALESIDRPVDRRTAAMDSWEPWNPAAGLFHTAVRNLTYRPEPPHSGLRFRLRDRPPPLKQWAEPRPSVELPLPGSAPDPLEATLLERRTWRNFGPSPLTATQIGTLLGMTWGIQAWMEVGDRAALKTSPSGGARHSIEAYLLAVNVQDLDPGLYHYDPDRHALSLVRAGATPQMVAEALPVQDWYAPAPAVVFMTSVFDRVQFRYGFARAYGVVLIEAGHLAQTFLLLATRLGLAPFCTAALAESTIERWLGVDGISEAVLYAVGVGTRPAERDWAPLPTSDPNPVRAAPAWASRRVP